MFTHAPGPGCPPVTSGRENKEQGRAKMPPLARELLPESSLGAWPSRLEKTAARFFDEQAWL